MTYTLKHILVNQGIPVSVITRDGIARVRAEATGSFLVRFPGQPQYSLSATYNVIIRIPETDDDDVPDPSGGGGERERIQTEKLALKLEIRKPDGTLFTLGDPITLNDLNKFRDLRGVSQGEWTFRVHGESEPIVVRPQVKRVTAPLDGHITIALEELVTSQSAPPLVNDTLLTNSGQRYEFDLFRVGTFTAIITSSGMLREVKMQLVDPDGLVVATSANNYLAYPVTLGTLDKSRDAQGKSRPWSLKVLPSVRFGGTQTKVWASVIETAHIRTGELRDRIDFLVGKGGNKLSIYGEVDDADLLVRLVIKDDISAETIDMHNLLDTDIEANRTYTLVRENRKFKYGLSVSQFQMKVSEINVEIGGSDKIQPAVPALKVEVVFEKATATVSWFGFDVATAKIPGNRIHLEAGLRLNTDGSFSPETWIEEDLVSVSVSAAALTAAAAAGGVGVLGVSEARDAVEEYVNNYISRTFRLGWAGVVNKVPRILAVVMGDDFTYRFLRHDSDDIVFEYVAPLEPEPKPSKHYDYLGIIGRSATQFGPNNWRITPSTLGDTWRAQNLNKIDHIVVVMMENRSFDHVLGYRAQLSSADGSDGLTTELMTFLESEGFPIRKLNESGIEPKTQFPKSVGHDFTDVAQQLNEIIKLPSGREINSPKGFIENFKKKHPELSSESKPKLEDVLGYYEADDLPFYKFLAENYAYCEKFYCSHPGPTLPNRMFSLTGDLQYDRTGEAILDNNDSDNFFLSRAMTIFDLLTRKGVGWRVYESFPSVTMLRMFARYATDNTNIVRISRLQEDIDRRSLPAVTFIDPAMHHEPPNDDHSPADMYRGQLFLKGVYDTLRSKEDLWLKTMLVITYDEHGGFYDHIVPPTADVLTRPGEVAQDPDAGGGHFTPSSMMINYGLRVPTFVVSPWSPVGKGPDMVLDFCSILKTILARFCAQSKPFISARVNASLSLDAYLSEPQPRMNVLASPTMPDLPFEPQHPGKSIITNPISRKKMRSGRVDYHDLTGMLARMLGR